MSSKHNKPLLDGGGGTSYPFDTESLVRLAKVFAVVALICVLGIVIWVVAGPQGASSGDDVGGCRNSGTPVISNLVFVNGTIHTMDSLPDAEAVCVVNGTIVFVGCATAAQNCIGNDTKIVNLNQQLMLPGFIDGHVHPIAGGLEMQSCLISGDATTVDAVLAIVRECVAAHIAKGLPATTVMEGSGWTIGIFAGTALPDKALLDAVSKEVPIFLLDADGHSAWANSKAIDLANIDFNTPAPAVGKVYKDDTGQPTGYFTEEASDLFDDILAEPTDDMRREAVRLGVAHANKYGITGMVIANMAYDDLPFLREATAKKELTSRISCSMEWDKAEDLAFNMKRWVKVQEDYADLNQTIRVKGAKLYIDGVLDSFSGALSSPYLNLSQDLGFPANFSGKPYFNQTELDEIVVAMDGLGCQIHAHAIGDLAVTMVLNAVEEAVKVNGYTDLRHNIAHVQLIRPVDQGRFQRTYANMQPYWFMNDRSVLEKTTPFLGEERIKWMYPMRGVLNAGGKVVCGSDWSVTTIDPIMGIVQGITRTEPPPFSDPPSPPLNPEQAVTVHDMLSCYTTRGAEVLFLEHQVGSITVGKRADFVVLDHNILSGDVAVIAKTAVVQTWFDGESVYQK